MPDGKGLAALFLKQHASAAEPDDPEDTPAPEPDDHRHDGDRIMRQAMDHMKKNDHQGAHDAMTSLIDQHLAKRSMGG